MFTIKYATNFNGTKLRSSSTAAGAVRCLIRRFLKYVAGLHLYLSRSCDEQAMAQYLGIGRGARANGAPPDGTLFAPPR